MKKTILCFTLVFLFGYAPYLAKAQQPDSILKNRIKFVSKDLNIGEKDAKFVIEILESFKLNAQAVLREKHLDPSVQRTKINALNEEKNKRLSKILKPEQIAKIKPVMKINPKEPSPFNNNNN